MGVFGPGSEEEAEEATGGGEGAGDARDPKRL